MLIQAHRSAIYISILILLAVFATASGQPIKITNITGDIYESESVTQKLDFDGIERLVFEASSGFTGTITVKVSTSDPKLVYSEHFKARSLDEAEEFSQFIGIETRRSTPDLMISTSARRGAPWQGTDQSARLEIEVSMPESLAVDLQAEYFDVSLLGPFTTVKVLNEYGRIKVSSVSEGLKIVTKNSRVNLEDINGAVDVTTSNNMIRAQKVDTRGGTAIFNNEYGVIEISRLTGVLECVTSYSAIDLRGIRLMSGRSRFITTYSSIDAEIIELQDADLYVTNDFSNVELVLPVNIEADFDLNVGRGGRIHLNGIVVTAEEMSRHRLIAHTENPDSRINVDVSGIGTISVTGKKFYGAP